MTLGQRALKSTAYVAAGTYASMAVTFVSSVVLARLLEPADFGLFALATFFMELFGRVREFGFDQALVHRQDNLKQARATHFTLRFSFSVLSLLLTLVALPILSNHYDPPMLKILVILSALMCLQGASATQRISLEKELRFGYTTLIDVSGLIVSVGTAVFLAMRGWGVWSLLANAVINNIWVFAGLWLFGPWKLSLKSLKIEREDVRWFLKFGWFLWLGGLTTFLLFKYNDFIAGTFLGAAVLGFYVKAFNFAQLPTSLVTSVISKVALPTYAKVQKDSEKLSETFNLVLRNIVRAAVPLSLVLFLVAHDFTLLLLGEKWLPMVPLLRLLLVYGVLRSIFDDAGAFLTAIGKPQVVAKYLGVQAALILFLSPLLGFRFGASGIAVALNLVMVVGVILSYWYVSREVKIFLLRDFVPSGIAAVGTLVAASLVFPVFSTLSLATSFLSKSLTAAVVYAVLLVLIERKSLIRDFSYLKSLLLKRRAG